MKVFNIMSLGFLTVLLSCGRPDPSKVEFDGRTFELPIKVKPAKERLGLEYRYYSGFFKGLPDDKSIDTQLEGYPLFQGSDNDREESYYDDYFAGITFFKENKTLEQFQEEFEKKYNKTFKTKTKAIEGMTTVPFNMTYYYIKTDDGLYIGLKEIERKLANKKYISISFYKGISGSELAKYLEYIY